MILCPSGPTPDILKQLPKSPRDWTTEQRQAAVERIVTLPLPAIRKRQDVVVAQMQTPKAQENPDIMADLQEMLDIETDAVSETLQ